MVADLVVLFVLERLVELKNISEQVGILLRKNLILSIRRWPWTLVQILAPVGIVALLIVLSFLTENVVKNFGLNDYVYPLSTPLGEFPACKSFGDLECVTFAYAPDNDPFVDKIIAQMKASEPTLSSSMRAFATEEALLDYIRNNPNTTYSGAAFTVTPPPLSSPSDPLTINYNVLYNVSYPLMSAYVSSAIDNAIFVISYEETNGIQWESGKPIEIKYKGYPKPPYPMDGQMMIFSQVGPQFFSLAIMITFISTLHSIVLEREYKLRIGMTVMGLKGVAYWISWFITAAVMTLLTTIATLVAGYAMFVDLFWGCNVLVLFTVFYIYGISLVVLAFVLSTLVSAGRNALILGFVVLGVSYLLNFVLANGSLMYMLWMDSVSPVWRSIFVWYPPFNFAKAFTDISTKASKVFSMTERGFVDGPGFGVLDFFKSIEYSFVDVDEKGQPIANYEMSVPPAYVSMLWLFANSLVFIVVAWYLDNFLNEAVGSRNPVFFLMPSFWGFNVSDFKTQHRVNAARMLNNTRLKALNSSKQGQTSSTSPTSPDDMDEDVLHEAIAAAEGNVFDTDVGLRIINLHKKFNPFWGLLARPGRLLIAIHKFLSRRFKRLAFLDNTMKNLWQPVHAVRGLNLRMEDGTCLALLGHNGAGKTTTMMLLNGLYTPTRGDAFMYGLSVRSNLQAIRHKIGICPQDNILWPELTAREHLFMFCQFKQIPADQINAEIDARLKDVGLYEVGKHRVSSYSGGMKRRLSVAIAFIGRPRMVLLDEPTTGMDPHSKRQVWQLIHDMKKGRMLLLTTHSMEEADALADRIGIMSDGALKCIGDSVHLKNKYGAGYNLSVVSTMSRVKDLIQIVKERLPDAELASENAGAVVYNIPRSSVQALGAFIEFLEDNQVKIKSKKLMSKSSLEALDQISPTEQTSQQDHLVLDWGISHTTLEDVYLKVTHAPGHDNSNTGTRTNASSPSENGSTPQLPPPPPAEVELTEQPAETSIFENIETIAVPEDSNTVQPPPAEPAPQTQPDHTASDSLLAPPTLVEERPSEHEPAQPTDEDSNVIVDHPGAVADTSPQPQAAPAPALSRDDDSQQLL